MRKSKALKFLCILSVFLFVAVLSKTGMAQVEGDDVVIGKSLTMTSKILEKKIQLSVHLPDGYEDSNERYPVLYTFQTHFELTSGVVKNLYDFNLTPKIIVVLIDNYEFGYLTPTKIESNPNSGQADRFLRFFKEELFQYFDSNYRTYPYRIVFSNSWGAMFAAYAVLAAPDIFNAAVASIPWVMYDGKKRFMISNAERFLKSRTYNNFLYMTMDNENELLPELDAFVDVIKNNPKQGLEWEYHHWPEEDHTSTGYRSIYRGLRALYGGWNRIPQKIVDQGLNSIKEYEVALNRRFGYKLSVSPVALRIAAQNLQKNNKPKEAILIFKYAVSKSPNDPFSYVSLGRAYEADNQFDFAKKAFEEAYRIAVSTSDPQVKWIKNHLDRINKKLELKNKWDNFA
jgi:predicted alpha/beta superfamily hydrolase